MQLQFNILKEAYAVCRCKEIPKIPRRAEFFSLTCTRKEISLVCPESWLENGSLPEEALQKVQTGWRAFGVAGTLDFSLVGILAEISGSLTRAGISMFAVSTFDTDYLLVQQEDLAAAQRALEENGHVFCG